VQSWQPFEVELDLFPVQIFQGKVDAIWWASGEASDIIPTFEPPDPQGPKTAVCGKDHRDQIHQTFDSQP
jgi:hypothetical protein